MTGTVLLLETDEQVIKDVTCSLRLIDITVVSSVSVAEAQQAVADRNPNIVIARQRITGDANAALSLTKVLSESNTSVPVYVLCTPSERATVEAEKKQFAGEVLLPVEFPAFAEKVRAIIGNSERTVPAGEMKPAAVTLAKVHRQDIPEESSEELADVDIKDRNFALAYTIQSKVLRELELDGRLQRASAEQVPGIVNQVTAKVCVRLASEKFL